MNDAWLNRLHSSMRNLTVSVTSIMWITLPCRRSLTVCGSSIVKNAWSSIVTSRRRCVLIVH